MAAALRVVVEYLTLPGVKRDPQSVLNLAVSSKDLYSAFENCHDLRPFKRDYIMKKHPHRWERHLRKHGLLTADAGLEWFFNNFKYDVVDALIETGLIKTITDADLLASKSGDGALVRALEESGLLLSDAVTVDWLGDHLDGACLLQALKLKGALTEDMKGSMTRDWLRDRMNGTWDGKALLSALKHAGLFGTGPGMDWYADAFKQSKYKVKAIMAAGLGDVVTKEWCVANLSKSETVTFMRDAGLLVSDFGQGRAHARDWYAANTGGFCLMWILGEAGLLTGECGPQWYLDKVPPGESLIRALRTAGLLTSINANEFREWICEKFPNEHGKVQGLRDAGLCTSAPGRDWYADRIKCPYSLAEALGHAGLLTSDVPREWFVERMSGRPGAIVSALRNSGLLTAEPGRDWYAKHVGEELERVLEETGLLTGDFEGARDWYAKYIKSDCLYKVLERTCLLTDFEGAREWYVSKLPYYHAFSTLKDLGLFTDAVDRDWYALHFKDEKLFKCLELAGLIVPKGNPQQDRDWFVKAFEGPASNLQQEYQGRALLCIERAGLLTPDAPVEWYGSVFSGKALYKALSATGLLSASLGRDWFAQRFKYRELYTVLKEVGLLSPECGSQWYVDAFAFDEKSEFQAWLHWREYRDKALYAAGLLWNNGTREWYATHLEGQELFDALKAAGLFARKRNVNWYARRFKGELLANVIREMGLGRDDFTSTWLANHFEGDLYKQMRKELGMGIRELRSHGRRVTGYDDGGWSEPEPFFDSDRNSDEDYSCSSSTESDSDD
jgi:hypothetical protein